MSTLPVRVLFVCSDNTSRSQIAEGWLRHLGGDRYVARSAGAAPRHLHPLATRVMQEVGIDIAAQRGKGLDAVRTERFDVVVTLCDTPATDDLRLPHAPVVHHHPIDDPTWIEDPEGADLGAFREVRDTLRDIVAALVARGDAHNQSTETVTAR